MTELEQCLHHLDRQLADLASRGVDSAIEEMHAGLAEDDQNVMVYLKARGSDWITSGLTLPAAVDRDDFDSHALADELRGMLDRRR